MSINPPNDLRNPSVPCDQTTRFTASLLVRAAYALADDPSIVIDHNRCREAAAKLDEVLNSDAPSRRTILTASPYVFERDGRVRTLVEMIEVGEDVEAEKYRLACLLLRALEWK